MSGASDFPDCLCEDASVSVSAVRWTHPRTTARTGTITNQGDAFEGRILGWGKAAYQSVTQG